MLSKTRREELGDAGMGVGLQLIRLLDGLVPGM